MDIIHWLARSAARLTWRKPVTPNDTHRDRALIARSLRTRLPAHLRRDIGVDDG
jgi:hypothetical protein